MKNKIRHFLERVIFKNKKTFLDHYRSIDRAAFDGFNVGVKLANERMIKDGRLERTL